jgi:hypothetical protein
MIDFPCGLRVSGLVVLSVVARSVAGMSVDPTGVGHPVPAVLVSLDAGLDRAGDAALFGLSDAELLAAVEESERLAARLAGLQARLVAELDGRGLAGKQGAASTAALLRHRLRLDPREAAGRTRLATDPELSHPAGPSRTAGIPLRIG